MDDMCCNDSLMSAMHDLVLEGFEPQYGRREQEFDSHPLWLALREAGTELWLDTGSLDEAAGLWTREFAALTTNNTLLNREVQTGRYDDLVRRAAARLDGFTLSDRQRRLELAFVLNAYHGLRLVERFDAFVSVEEHTDLAHDVDAAVVYARRYAAVCPERFTVKLPLTPAGLIATRRVVEDGIRVNHTLGFSARQNYVIARLGRPDYVNVFLGRLNSFVADNGLGSGDYVGERATLVSARAVRELRERGQGRSRQIAASLRGPEQVRDLAGVDVMTLPPKVARGFLGMGLEPAAVAGRTDKQYEPGLDDGTDRATLGLDALWDIPEQLIHCVDAADAAGVAAMTADDLVDLFADHQCGDVLVRWTDEQVAASRAEGKIPRLDTWRDALAAGAIGLDSVMNLAGLCSFAADQQAMDEKVSDVLER